MRKVPQIAVVVATCDRPCLLAKRSLASVVAQSLCPDAIVVVDDSCSSASKALNATHVGSMRLANCKVTYLENQRTSGASGAWNSAMDVLMDMTARPEHLFVAFLDDDDAWSPDYLESCLNEACGRQLDMVAADLRRIESACRPPLLNAGPSQLRVADFLIGNPGIQSSNLFIRLSSLLHAGGFDEALRSTTDRDLCIRIAELGTVRYGRLATALVDHFADSDRPRLSTYRSEAKQDGLSSFWQKYAGRMTSGQRRAFADRAKTYFGWNPFVDSLIAYPNDRKRVNDVVLGIAVDRYSAADLTKGVLLLARSWDHAMARLRIVLLETVNQRGEYSAADQGITALRDAGVPCFRVSFDLLRESFITQLTHWAEENSSEYTGDFGRELLRVYCARIVDSRKGAEIWLATGNANSALNKCGTGVQRLFRQLSAEQVDSCHVEKFPDDPHTLRFLDGLIQNERVATAEHRVLRRFARDQVRLLGCGSEAVVFTDECTVYKYIDDWVTRLPRSQLDFLRQQTGKWEGALGLYAIRAVTDDGSCTVITYDYEPSVPYKGGRKEALICLLKGCCDAGVVCNNLHPKNLVVVSSAVKLIDYGADIRPWSLIGFEHMARRAYLACEQADHPQLSSLMRRSLSDTRFSEMNGYPEFRCRLQQMLNRVVQNRNSPSCSSNQNKFKLYVGVITSDPSMLKGLLDSLNALHVCDYLQSVAVLILDNGSSDDALENVVQYARVTGMEIAVVSKAKQHLDAAAGSFGSEFPLLIKEQAGIARARTMLQRYLGAVLAAEPESIGWMLDDDMRVDERANCFLPWLPAFREQGVDALIGAYEGASPNPPLNGLRVQLVDVLHNLHWLLGLPSNVVLPDRATETNNQRTLYPDYYYDLSRKHTAHLEMPQWLTPTRSDETVADAYSRVINGAVSLLNGVPLTRPVKVALSGSPLPSARDSVNRGGNTFILNHRALSETPNSIITLCEQEARRSDMIWAIVNRYYRRLKIRAVAFPVNHVPRQASIVALNEEKVRGEIVGSTLYAGLMEYLCPRFQHRLNFSSQDADEVCLLSDRHLAQRWRMLEQSWYRIIGIREALRTSAPAGDLQDLLEHLDKWFTPGSFECLRSTAKVHDCNEVRNFLYSLRRVADDYALGTVDIEFIQQQFRRARHDNA